MGKFNLRVEIVGMMRGDQPLTLTDADLTKLPA
jgi:hypothetical protein